MPAGFAAWLPAGTCSIITLSRGCPTPVSSSSRSPHHPLSFFPLSVFLLALLFAWHVIHLSVYISVFLPWKVISLRRGTWLCSLLNESLAPRPVAGIYRSLTCWLSDCRNVQPGLFLMRAEPAVRTVAAFSWQLGAGSVSACSCEGHPPLPPVGSRELLQDRQKRWACASLDSWVRPGRALPAVNLGGRDHTFHLTEG